MDALAWLKTHGAATESEYPYQGVQQACQPSLGVSGPKSAGYHNVIPRCKNNHCDDQYKFELDLMLHAKGTRSPSLPTPMRAVGSTSPTASTQTTNAPTHGATHR